MAGSLGRVLIGFAIGAAIGIPLGLAIGTIGVARPRRCGRSLDALRSIAPIAWIPMAILWLGVRGNAALFVVAYAAVFPFIVNASQAVRLVDRRLVNAAHALGASALAGVPRGRTCRRALPMIFTGARIALAFAWALDHRRRARDRHQGGRGGAQRRRHRPADGRDALRAPRRRRAGVLHARQSAW